MTKDQILVELEALKELTNNSGKQMIDGIKAGVMALDMPSTTVIREPEIVFEKPSAMIKRAIAKLTPKKKR